MKEEFFQSNSYYEGLVQNLYGGGSGCFAMFMHFFYQYGQSCVYASQYVDCFCRLYELELQNCQILSGILIKMGGDNKYYSNSRKFLSGFNVDYVKDFSQIYLLDVELIEVSLIETKSIIAKIENKNIKELLKIILKNKRIEIDLLKENFFKKI